MNTIACVAGAWKWWAQEKTGARAPVLSFPHNFQAPATQAINTTMRCHERLLARQNFLTGNENCFKKAYERQHEHTFTLY